MRLFSRPLLVTAAIGVCSAAGLTVFAYVVLPNRPPSAKGIVPHARTASPPPDARTVSWFKAHVPELRAELAVCKDDPGKARTDSKCSNAQHAQWDLSFDAFLGKPK